MVIPGHLIPHTIVTPFHGRIIHEETGLSGGLSYVGYDVHLDQDLIIPYGTFVLGSTVENFNMPNWCMGVVHDKSTLARQGIFVQNTVIEPGWTGFLTLEISATPRISDSLTADLGYRGRTTGFTLVKGQPIAQVVFHKLMEPVRSGYNGKYQNQPRGPQESILEK